MPIPYSCVPLELQLNLLRFGLRSTGDPARLEAYSTGSGAKKAARGSSKKGAAVGKTAADAEDDAVEGVVARVAADRVVLSVEGNRALELPERLSLCVRGDDVLHLLCSRGATDHWNSVAQGQASQQRDVRPARSSFPYSLHLIPLT